MWGQPSSAVRSSEDRGEGPNEQNLQADRIVRVVPFSGESAMSYFVKSHGPAVLKRGPFDTEEAANRKRDELRLYPLYKN